MIKIYKNKKWLEKKYTKEKLSTRKIGKIVNVNNKVIWRWLQIYNIPRRSITPNNIKYRNKEWLYKKYIKEKLSMPQISEICNISSGTINNWMKKYNITPRSSGEGVHCRKGNHCKLSRKAIKWINGELLGDGSLQSKSPFSARIDYSSKYLEYIRYISDTLKSFGIRQSGKILKKHLTDRDMDCYTYQYNSLTYPELSLIYKKWYPRGKKIVPKDIKLTPLTCRQWYIGDGCLDCTNRGRPSIIIATNGFIPSDVKWLVNQLNKLGFKNERRLSNNTIGISVFSTKDFLNYIGKCPVKCYQYKWDYKHLPLRRIRSYKGKR